MLKRILLLFLVLVLCMNLASAYEANIIINVYKNGAVEIKGSSDHPLLKEGMYDDLTTKEGGYWLLNLTTEERFSDYKYEINFPENTAINYLGVYSVDSFEDDNGFRISGTVKNRPFKITIQYKYELFKRSYLYMILLLVCLAGFAGYYLYRKKKPKKVYSDKHFSERELAIIKLLQKNKGCLTQADLERKTGLPKASLHRNIASLERKSVVEKNRIGMSSKVCLK